MQTRALTLRHGLTVFVTPLRNGDVETVRSVFERLGDASRRARFNGAKRCLSGAELDELATVDARHHVLVAHVPGDPKPAAVASLVRTSGTTAEIAFAVVDGYQHRGVGSALAGELVADGRAAGITEITALTAADNRAAVALIKRCARVRRIAFDGPELTISAAIS